MALLALEGVYEDGKIELQELPAGVRRARVVVTFLPEENGTGAVQTVEEDREAARQRAFARMKAGIDFGGQKFDRNEIYEERICELDARREKRR